jgi:hypothetical protein
MKNLLFGTKTTTLVAVFVFFIFSSYFPEFFFIGAVLIWHHDKIFSSIDRVAEGQNGSY